MHSLPPGQRGYCPGLYPPWAVPSQAIPWADEGIAQGIAWAIPSQAIPWANEGTAQGIAQAGRQACPGLCDHTHTLPTHTPPTPQEPLSVGLEAWGDAELREHARHAAGGDAAGGGDAAVAATVERRVCDECFASVRRERLRS